MHNLPTCFKHDGLLHSATAAGVARVSASTSKWKCSTHYSTSPTSDSEELAMDTPEEGDEGYEKERE